MKAAKLIVIEQHVLERIEREREREDNEHQKALGRWEKEARKTQHMASNDGNVAAQNENPEEERHIMDNILEHIVDSTQL